MAEPLEIEFHVPLLKGEAKDGAENESHEGDGEKQIHAWSEIARPIHDEGHESGDEIGIKPAEDGVEGRRRAEGRALVDEARVVDEFLKGMGPAREAEDEAHQDPVEEDNRVRRDEKEGQGGKAMVIELVKASVHHDDGDGDEGKMAPVEPDGLEEVIHAREVAPEGPGRDEVDDDPREDADVIEVILQVTVLRKVDERGGADEERAEILEAAAPDREGEIREVERVQLLEEMEREIHPEQDQNELMGEFLAEVAAKGTAEERAGEKEGDEKEIEETPLFDREIKKGG